MSAPFHVVIPARHASSRLPGKPLLDLAGTPMVVRVLQQAARAGAASVCVATDHPEIARVVTEAGGTAVMTRSDHATGTDRLAEVVEQMGWPDDTVVVNVQGDEPLMDPALIRRVGEAAAEAPEAAIATAAHPLRSLDEFRAPSVVKVVCNHLGDALYFSRAPLPWPRDAFAAEPDVMPESLAALRHVGLYAYRAGFLRRFGLLTPAPCEVTESLEQLRALWHGERIRVVVLEEAPEGGVDTEADLERVRAALTRRPD